MIAGSNGIPQNMVTQIQARLIGKDKASVIASECHDQVEFGEIETSVYIYFVDDPGLVTDIQVAADKFLAP